MPKPHIAVVGAGVIGLTTAIELLDAGMTVTVHAADIPGRTSLAAGASWGPYLVEPYDRVRVWSGHTLSVLTGLARVAGSGVAMVSGIEASRAATEMPDWARALPDVRGCVPDELPAGFRSGWRYVVPVVDMPIYLEALLDRFRRGAGVVMERYVERFDDVAAGADVVVNCAGLGASVLAGDPTLYPIRGQLVVVRNPGISEFFSEDTGISTELLHYLPQGDTVILGGLALPHDGRMDVDEAAGLAILERCVGVEPRLRGANVIEHRVGLRPTRSEIRLEAERVGGVSVVHNYGHGGAGVSLSWGCAREVRGIVQTIVDELR
jgi:D-amino-acid oxidase